MPQVEVWERVLVDSDFANTTHGQIGCRTCHGGAAGVNEKDAAHVGMVIDPSAGDAPACKDCHADIAANVQKSLHATQQGYFTAFAARSGKSIDDPDFAAMFDDRCASCHGTCGQCHISRPASVRGGLTRGHAFYKTPSLTDNCTACHGSRVGDEFLGKNTGIPEDVHWRNGMNCMACHDDVELHGDGTTPTYRHSNDAGPQCDDCHPIAELSGTYHSTHAATVACQVCHSMPYKNCYQCHVELDEQGLRIPSEMDFRIGRNPAKSSVHPQDYVLLRHIPIAPDTFDPWGIQLPNYTDEPTWRLATPHNIQKNTPQTESCSNCHGSLDLFLTSDYLQELVDDGLMVESEITANDDLVVDEAPSLN